MVKPKLQVLLEITEADLPAGEDWRNYTAHNMVHGYLIALRWVELEVRAGTANKAKKELYDKYFSICDILYIKTHLDLV
jgi:hypothetical protein